MPPRPVAAVDAGRVPIDTGEVAADVAANVHGKCTFAATSTASPPGAVAGSLAPGQPDALGQPSASSAAISSSIPGTHSHSWAGAPAQDASTTVPSVSAYT